MRVGKFVAARSLPPSACELIIMHLNVELTGSRAAAAAREAEVRLRAVVDDEHQGATNAAEDVRHEALVESTNALVRHDLLEAIARALVELLLRRLLALHLKAAADRVEGVRRAGAERDRG